MRLFHFLGAVGGVAYLGSVLVRAILYFLGGPALLRGPLPFSREEITELERREAAPDGR